jgi:hypothetical protein
LLTLAKRKLKSITTEFGMMLPAPVPPWMLLTWKLVGGKKSLPRSHSVFASSSSAGSALWIGLSPSCG